MRLNLQAGEICCHCIGTALPEDKPLQSMDHKPICVFFSENSFLVSVNLKAVRFCLVYSKNARLCVQENAEVNCFVEPPHLEC